MKILVFNGSLGILKTLELAIKSANDHEVDKIVCLGDLIGVGYENSECLDIARRHEIQVVSGICEAIATGQVESNCDGNPLIDRILAIRDEVSKEDFLWLSNLRRLTIIEDLLFMYGTYIDRYSLFKREHDFVETDLITRKKHPMLEGLVVGSSNPQTFYNGKKLVTVRTNRVYNYTGLDPAKIIASPGRLVNLLRTGVMKSSWIIIDTKDKSIEFITDRGEVDESLLEVNPYNLESIFSND